MMIPFALGGTKTAGEIALICVCAIIWTEVCGTVKRALADESAKFLRADVVARCVVDLRFSKSLHLKCTACCLLCFNGLDHITRRQVETIVPLVQDRLRAAVVNAVA
jgi:hypothetical protein